MLVTFLTLLMVGGPEPPSHAHGGWLVLNAQGPVSRRTRGLSWWGEHQTRRFQGVHQLVTRPGVGYRLRSGISGWLGYDWLATLSDTGSAHEQRIWQQVIVPVGSSDRVQLIVRARLEQRFLPAVDGVPLRLRHLLRLRLAATHWLGVVGWDETFWHVVGGRRGGPKPGLDHNRAFAGLSWRITSAVGLETGYMNHRVFAAGRDHVTHLGVLFAFFTLSAAQKGK